MNEPYNQLCSLFNTSLFQIDSTRVDTIAKKILALSRDPDMRDDCYTSGMTTDLCDWLLQCGNYFSELSEVVQSAEHVNSPVEVTVSMSVLSIATNLVRILRNICTDNKQNQEEILVCNLPQPIIAICMNKHLWGAGEMSWSEGFELFVQISLQLLYNITATNVKGKHAIWSYIYPNCIIFLLKHYSHNEKIASFAIAIFCICDCNDNSESLERLNQVIQNIDCMNLMFSRGLSSDDDKTTQSEWISYFVRTLLLLSDSRKSDLYFMTMFNTLVTASFPLVSPAQLLFLNYCLDVSDDDNITITESILTSLLKWLVTTTEQANIMISRNETRVFDEDKLKDTKSEDGQKLRFLIETYGVCLPLVAGQSNNFSDTFKNFILHSKVLDLFLAILAIPQIVASTTSTTANGEVSSSPAMIMNRDDIWSYGTRDAVLQILGNVVYCNYEAQEAIRTRGGIELVLNHTKIHPKHPLQREWALFTIRNLCANNPTNQQYIDGFKAEAVAAEPALEKLGVKVKLDEGKVKVEKI